MDSSGHYSHNMPPGDAHYPQQHQQPQQTWPQSPHLLSPVHGSSQFPSPAATSSSGLSEQHYPAFYSAQQGPGHDAPMDGPPASLSLNLSALTVASPTNLSPIHPPSTASTTLSPTTPHSPASATPHHHTYTSHHHSHIPPFQYAPPEHGGGVRYDQAHYDIVGRRPTTSGHSSSSSEKSVPRKRSFTASTPLTPSLEESIYSDTTNGGMELSASASYDEVDMAYGLDPGGSPVDGSSSSGDLEDQYKQSENSHLSGLGTIPLLQQPGSVIGKPAGTNNFVTKLYQMINDPKSALFIAWTELGTSFVVSNVGEFSRSILGSHFKHNNFSSFVRQLNMYGFHKINRTPRAQRTSTDAQTWEFSHHKFLRGRPDLLEEIKRKALEPDPSIKHRVELPGEVASQLGQMRDENRRVVRALNGERVKVERLVHVTKMLYDMMAKAVPGGMPFGFPADLLDPSENPFISITSPASSDAPSHFAPSMSSHSLHSLHSFSPNSSPTTADFPSHVHSPQSLSRQQSFQHGGYDSPAMHCLSHGVSTTRYETALTTPLPPSPGPLDHFSGEVTDRGSKRQRTGDTSSADVSGSGSGGPSSKKLSRARSDSAPLGYAMGNSWTGNRPRSGSGLGPRGMPTPRNSGSGSAHSQPQPPMLTIPSSKPPSNQ